MTSPKNITFVLLVDRASFKDKPKPTGAEIGAIRNRLASPEARVTVSIEELEQLVRSGFTIMPGVCAGGTRLENWRSQQIFVLDFDNDDAMRARGFDPISHLEAMKRALDHGLGVLFAYSTHSAHDHYLPDRYRLVFATSSPVTSRERAESILRKLHALFPEADPSGDNLSKMYFSPGKLLIAPVDGQARILDVKLLDALVPDVQPLSSKMRRSSLHCLP